MHRHDHAAGKPDAGIGREVERVVRDAHVHGLVCGEAGLRQGAAHRMRGGKVFAVGKAVERFAGGEALRRFREQGAEIQAARLTVNPGGWRSDCATTQ